MPTALERKAISRSPSRRTARDFRQRSAHERAVPRQQDSGESPGSARPGLSTCTRCPTRPASTATLRHAEPSIDWPRSSTCSAATIGRPTRIAGGEVPELLHEVRRHQRRRASARWGLVRQRYDFDVDIGKVDYTRILNTRRSSSSRRLFNSIEYGPRKTTSRLPASSARRIRSSRGSASLPGSTTARSHPQRCRQYQSADRAQSNDGGTAWITYDGRWPIYGNDIAINAAINLTHTRGRHTYKMGVMREDELFSQARSGTFGGQFNFADDALHPNRTGYAWANAVLGQVARYTESMGRVPDDRRQKTWAWYVQDTWKPTSKITLDLGLRMYKWGPALAQGGESSVFSDERFDPRWGGTPPVFYQPVLSGTTRSARHPQTGQILPATFIGLMVPGTGYNCTQVITATRVRDQRHRDAERWHLPRWRRRGLHRTHAAFSSIREPHGVGAQSENRHSRGGRVVPRRHGRRVRAAR